MLPDDLDRFLEAMYAARVASDMDGMLAFFTDDAHFEMKGVETSDAIPMCCQSREQVALALRGLVDAIDFIEHTILSRVVDRNTVALQTRVRVRARNSGQEHTTETADFLTFRDGRVASFVQYCNTALARSMI